MRNPCQFCFLCKCLCVSVGVGVGGGGACIPVRVRVRACVWVCVRARARPVQTQRCAHNGVTLQEAKKKKKKKKLIFQRARTVTHSQRADGLQETPTPKKRAERHPRMHALKFLRGSFPDTANSFASGCCVRKRTTLIIYKARGAIRPAGSIWFCAAVLQCEVPILCAAPHCVIIGLSQRWRTAFSASPLYQLCRIRMYQRPHRKRTTRRKTAAFSGGLRSLASLRKTSVWSDDRSKHTMGKKKIYYTKYNLEPCRTLIFTGQCRTYLCKRYTLSTTTKATKS